MVRPLAAKRQTSIKNRIALTTLVTVSIVLISVSSAFFFYFHSVLSKNIFKHQFDLVTEIAEQLDGRIQLARLQLSLAATEITGKALANPSEIERIFDNFSTINMIFDAGFTVIGTDGRVIAENMGFTELVGKNLNNEEYVSESLRTGKPAIYGPFSLTNNPGIQLIAIVNPVRDNNDKVTCLLVGYHTIGNDQFLTFLSPKRFGEISYLYILHDRTILMHPDKSRVMDLIPEGKNLGIDLALKGFEGSLENVNSKGLHMVSSFKKIGETGWILGANTNYEEAFSPINKLVLITALISVFGIIFALAVLWYVSRRLTLPIRQLTDYVVAAKSDAELSQPVLFRTGDEIEQLSDAFNSLMQEVHDTKHLLKREKDFFSDIIQNAAAPMLVIDYNHKIIFWNTALTKLTGKSAEEMIGTNRQWTPFYDEERPVIADLVIDQTLDRADELYSNYSSGQSKIGSLRAEGWYENIGGKRRYIFFEAAPVRNSKQEVIAAVETLEDITERKIIETELAESNRSLKMNHAKLEELFAQVARGKREWEETLDHLRDFIILTDSDHRVRRFNKLLADATGRKITKLVGLDWRDLMRVAGFDFVSFNGTIGEIFHKKTGNTYDIFVYPLEVGSQIEGYVVSLNDTTQLRVASQELQKAYLELKDAQMHIFQQEKMASIGQLAAGVAHEINNPMGFVSSNLTTLGKYMERLTEYITAGELAIESCRGDEAEKLKNLKKSLKIDYISDDSRLLISESQDGASRVRRIVQDLMSFSRADQAETVPVNLNDVLDTAINFAGNEIKYIATINREFGDLPEIKCSSQQLNQVFLNLLVNAGHAMSGTQDGIITIRSWCEGDYACVSITDSGCGIPEDIRQKIFDPFFTTKEVGKGTGLGLSISHEILKKHGGDITVESEIGVGSTFTVRLPVNVVPPELE